MAGEQEPRPGSAAETVGRKRTTVLATVARFETQQDAERITTDLQQQGYAVGAAGLWFATVRRDGKIALRLQQRDGA